PISAALGTLSAANYSFAFQDGVFTVTAPPSQSGPAAAPMPAEAMIVAQPARLTGLQAVPNGIQLTFSASPGATYQIERASGLQSSGTVWTNIGSATTDASGQGKFTDTNPPATQGYYRTVSQ